MKRILYMFALLTLVFSACNPMEDDMPDIGAAPSASDLAIEIKPTDDPYRFTVTNNSSVTGMAQWDLGNGRITKGEEVVGYYPLPGTYTIKLTLYTKGGSTSITKELVTTETDYALFEDPFFTALSGGTEALEGKTWVMDSTTSGHFGVGPAGDASPSWWAAAPLAKVGHFIYDDEFTFVLDKFVYKMNTHGKTHGKISAVDQGIAAGYYGATTWTDVANDYDVLTNDAARGAMTWMAEKVGNKYFINLSAPGAVIGYDAGGERRYEVLSWTENTMHLKVIDIDGNARFNKIIRKGYSDPQVTLALSVTAGTNVNEFEVKLSDVVIPAGKSITSVSFDFGDGSAPVVLSDYTKSATHVYMRKNNYPVVATVVKSDGTVTLAGTATVAQNHPDYVPFNLDMMVMYQDFSETALVQMGFDVAGSVGSLTTVANPNASLYPNRSANVAKFSKENNEWGNAFMKLPTGYRFDLSQNHVFEVKVYGKAGDKVLLKLENTDRGGNAWQTGTADYIYTIQKDNTWEVARFDFAGKGAGMDWTGDIFTSDITTDPRFSEGFYNVIRIMLNPGVNSGAHTFYFDDLAGPHIEGLK